MKLHVILSFQAIGRRIECWYSSQDLSDYVEAMDEGSSYEMEFVDPGDLGAIEPLNDGDDDDSEELLSEEHLDDISPMYEAALRQCIEATGSHLRLGPPPWIEANLAPTPDRLTWSRQPPSLGSSDHTDTVHAPERAADTERTSSPSRNTVVDAELMTELIVEIHVPLDPTFGLGWIDDIEDYLVMLDGSAGEAYDDGESLGDEYLFFLASASKSQLIELATRVAKLPGVPTGSTSRSTTRRATWERVGESSLTFDEPEAAAAAPSRYHRASPGPRGRGLRQ